MAYRSFFVLRFRLELAMPRSESGRAREREHLFLLQYHKMGHVFTPQLLLGAFAKLRKVSVCPHGATRLPRDVFL